MPQIMDYFRGTSQAANEPAALSIPIESIRSGDVGYGAVISASNLRAHHVVGGSKVLGILERTFGFRPQPAEVITPAPQVAPLPTVVESSLPPQASVDPVALGHTAVLALRAFDSLPRTNILSEEEVTPEDVADFLTGISDMNDMPETPARATTQQPMEYLPLDTEPAGR